ncbi:MAG: hypothetical protein JXR73_22325 [Candidatus Omnitrophica bacterium]|nr:hypothetical protein [Candidatus Omnitrophota bacterium]
MKTRLAFILAVGLALHLSWLTVWCQEEEKTFDLRNQFHSGQTVYLDLKTTTQGVATTKTSSKPAQTPINSELESVISYKTAGIGADQQALIEIAFHRMMMSGEMLGGTTQDLLDNLGLTEKIIRLKASPKGKIEEAAGEADKRGGLNDSAQSFTRQLPYLQFPDQPVALGAQWKESRRVPYSTAAKPLIAYTTYELDKVIEENGENIAVIKTDMHIHETDIPIDSSSQTGDLTNVIIKFTYKEFTMAGRGEIRFSLDKGRVLSAQNTQNVTIHMEGSTDINKSSFLQDVVQSYVQQSLATFSEESPLTKDESTDESKHPN